MFLSMTLKKTALFENKNSVNFRGQREEKKGAPTMKGYLAMCMKTKTGKELHFESLAMFMKNKQLTRVS